MDWACTGCEHTETDCERKPAECPMCGSDDLKPVCPMCGGEIDKDTRVCFACREVVG